VCSGGRYDDLVSLYSKESMPGVGASIGLDRLIAAMEEIETGATAPAPAEVLITMQDSGLLAHYHALATELRGMGLRCEVYPDDRKLGQQFSFAERKGIPYAIICGRDEAERGTVNLRILEDRTSLDDLTPAAVVARIRGE
jgi:histidyl-tRNA synthetase